MSKRNRLTLLSFSILGVTTSISCTQNTIKKQEIKEIDTKLNIQKENQFLDKNKNDESLLLDNNINNKDSYLVVESSLIENNNIGNIGKINLKLELNAILNINKIFKKWNKRVKQTLKNKRELEAYKKKKQIIVATTTTLSSLLLVSGIIGASVYLFKYNRELLHKTEAFLVDLILKAFLKFKRVDIDFENSFRNLMFYLFKENEESDKKLIDFIIKKAKDIIHYKKGIENLIEQNEIKEWIKQFKEDKNKNNNSISNNPISYFLKILEGNNGEKILIQLIKLLTKISKKPEELNAIPGFDKLSDLFKKTETKKSALSNITTILAGLDGIKNSVEFIIEKGKIFLDEEKNGLFTIWIKFINVLGKIISKNNFKDQYKNDLENLYNFFFNTLKKVFKDTDLKTNEPNKNGSIFDAIGSILGNFIIKTFKIDDVVTPDTIKNWIENYKDKKEKQV